VDLAGQSIQLHAGFFGQESLLSFAGKLRISLNDQRLATALSGWLFFGAYVVRQGITPQVQ